MNRQERPPIWATLLWILVWILLLANVVYDYVQGRRITPFSVLMFFALLVGSTLVPRLLKQPNYSPQGGVIRLIITMFLLAITLVFILARIFI